MKKKRMIRRRRLWARTTLKQGSWWQDITSNKDAAPPPRNHAIKISLNFTSSSCVIWCWSPNTCSPWVKVSETLVNFSLVIVTPVVRGSLANPGQITPAGPISEPTQRIATRGGPHSPVQHLHLHHPLPDNHLPTDTNKGVIWPLNNFRGMTVEDWSNTQRRTNCENILMLFLGFNANFRHFQVNLRHFSHGLVLG